MDPRGWLGFGAIIEIGTNFSAAVEGGKKSPGISASKPLPKPLLFAILTCLLIYLSDGNTILA